MKFLQKNLSVALVSFLFALQMRAQPVAHNFAKWEGEITAFERSDATNPPPKGAVLFIGSSGIRLWKSLARDFPGQPVINRGFGGSEIEDSTHFAERIVFPYEPRMIFLRAGGNDLADGKSPGRVFEDYTNFVAEVRSKLPQTDIVFIGWNPTPLRWKQHEKERELNRLVEAFSKTAPHLEFIDCYDMVLGADGKPRPELFVADRLHFNAEGYKLLVAKVRPFLPKP